MIVPILAPAVTDRTVSFPKDAKYTCKLYDDDGETFACENGNYLELDIEIASSKEQVAIEVERKEGMYHPRYQNIKVNVIGLSKGQHVIINGAKSGKQATIHL